MSEEENNKEIIPDYPLQTWFDLMTRPISKRKWLTDILVPENGIILVASTAGLYKTFTMLHLAVCLATGKPVFGKWTVPEPVKVLFVDEENTEMTLRERLGMLLKGMHIEFPCNNLCYLSQEGIRLDVKETFLRLKKFIVDHEIRCVIIDSFMDVHTRSENDAQEMMSIFRALKASCKELNVSWIVIHHERKSSLGSPSGTKESIRGSSAITGAVDVGISFVTSGNDDSFVMINSKARLAEKFRPQQIDVIISDGSADFRCAGDSSVELDLSTDCARRLLIWIKDGHNIFTMKEVFSMMSDYSKATVKRALLSLMYENKVYRVERGTYGLTVDNLSKHLTLKAEEVQRQLSSEGKAIEPRSAHGEPSSYIKLGSWLNTPPVSQTQRLEPSEPSEPSELSEPNKQIDEVISDNERPKPFTSLLSEIDEVIPDNERPKPSKWFPDEKWILIGKCSDCGAEGSINVTEVKGKFYCKLCYYNLESTLINTGNDNERKGGLIENGRI